MTEKKDKNVIIRVTSTEKELLKRVANYHNLSVSELLLSYVRAEDQKILHEILVKGAASTNENGDFY